MENESVDGICEWDVPEKTIYNVSNYMFYNYGSGPGGVLVQNEKKQNTTIASGYYLITGLPDGTCNVSFSKAGLNTAYLDVSVNSTNKTIVNTTYVTTFSAKDSYNNGWGQNVSIVNVKTAPHSDKNER